MGEEYWGDLEIDIPESLPAPVSSPRAWGVGPGITWDVDAWMTEVFGTTDEDDLLPPQEERLEHMRELLGEIDSWLIDNEHLEVDGRTIKAGGLHNFGISHWTEDSQLQETCQKHGIAYRLWDDGKYEIPGEEREWKPGMETPADRGHSAAGTVLDRSDMDALFVKAAGDLATFGQLVRDYFG